MNLLFAVMPAWSRWLVIGLLIGFVFMFGQMRGERIAGERHIDYVTKQASQTVKITRAQTKVLVDVQIKYLDRVKTIYLKGATIEQQIPIYITSTDNARCSINAGFVREYNAAWTGHAAGTAFDSDRDPTGIPLAEVAAADAYNATSCLAWREQALGLREFYERLKTATNTPPR